MTHALGTNSTDITPGFYRFLVIDTKVREDKEFTWLVLILEIVGTFKNSDVTQIGKITEYAYRTDTSVKAKIAKSRQLPLSVETLDKAIDVEYQGQVYIKILNSSNSVQLFRTARGSLPEGFYQ